MKTFTDAKNRTWNIYLNFGTLMQVRENLQIDLLQPEQGIPPLITRLGTDEILLGQVIFELIQKQFGALNLEVEDVHEAFTGSVLLAAQTAFYEEMINFFLGRGRPDRAKAVQKQMDMITAAVVAMTDQIENIDVNSKIAELIDGAKSGNLPDSLV